MNKEEVIRRHKERVNARQALIGDAQETRQKLSPASLWNRWKNKQRKRIVSGMQDAAIFAKQNAGVIGGAFGLGALLAASWGPVKRRISKEQNEHTENLYDDER